MVAVVGFPLSHRASKSLSSLRKGGWSCSLRVLQPCDDPDQGRGVTGFWVGYVVIFHYLQADGNKLD